ncbi:hypothetical protein [Ruegeria sp. HKCCSP346]|uniref:hypothetical protein n=1 Tax=Ruegeria sp. HKCCSP346 TaxID=2794830 RepID=UPI001AE3602C|nr:hypothetical protein [Ruegeria sp. HKCCSP346]
MVHSGTLECGSKTFKKKEKNCFDVRVTQPEKTPVVESDTQVGQPERNNKLLELTMNRTSKQVMAKAKMTSAAAARIQSATAKSRGGKVSTKSFAARAQRAASKPIKR